MANPAHFRAFLRNLHKQGRKIGRDLLKNDNSRGVYRSFNQAKEGIGRATGDLVRWGKATPEVANHLQHAATAGYIRAAINKDINNGLEVTRKMLQRVKLGQDTTGSAESLLRAGRVRARKLRPLDEGGSWVSAYAPSEMIPSKPIPLGVRYMRDLRTYFKNK